MLVVVICVVVSTTCVFGAFFGGMVLRGVGGVDGDVRLAGPYKLWNLKGYSRYIATGDGGPLIPSESLLGGPHGPVNTLEVGRHAVQGDVIFGEIVSYPESGPGWTVAAWFVIDVKKRRHVEYRSEAEWKQGLGERGVATSGVVMTW